MHHGHLKERFGELPSVLGPLVNCSGASADSIVRHPQADSQPDSRLCQTRCGVESASGSFKLRIYDFRRKPSVNLN